MGVFIEMSCYKKDEHVIYHGDAMEILKSNIENESIDLIFVDPPYNIGKVFSNNKDKWNTDEEYLKWSYEWIDLCVQKLKPNGSMYVMTSTQFMPFFDIYIRGKMNIISRIIWTYDSSRGTSKKTFWIII